MFLLIFYCRAPGLINIKVFDQDSENDYSGVILHCGQVSMVLTTTTKQNVYYVQNFSLLLVRA